MMAWLKALRTVRGQVILFAATFLGAIVLALLALLLRERVFEYYVREKYPVLAEVNRKRIEELSAQDVDPKRLDELLGAVGQPDNWAQVYGAWIEQPGLDPDDRLGKRLASAFSDHLPERLKRTLVAGNLEQRGRALRGWCCCQPTRGTRCGNWPISPACGPCAVTKKSCLEKRTPSWNV
jgi:hypothetical protein